MFDVHFLWLMQIVLSVASFCQKIITGNLFQSECKFNLVILLELISCSQFLDCGFSGEATQVHSFLHFLYLINVKEASVGEKHLLDIVPSNATERSHRPDGP